MINTEIKNTKERLQFPNVDAVTTLQAVEAVAADQMTSITDQLKDIPSSELQMAYLQSIAGGILALMDDVRFVRNGHIPQ